MARCYFCANSTTPTYKDIETLERYLTPRKKILSSEKSGVCAKHQRKLNKHIKYARFLALLPFTSYQGAL